MIDRNAYYQSKPIASGRGSRGLIAWFTYFIVYSGYLKILFPEISRFFTIVQMGSIVTGTIYVFYLNRIVVYNRVFASPIVHTAIFFTAMTFVALWTNNQNNALNKVESMVVTLFFMIVLYLMGTLIDTAKKYDYLFSIIIVTNIAFLLLYVVIHISSIRQMVYAGLRGGSSESNPIWIARIAGDTALFLLISKSRWGKIASIISLIFLAFLTVFMGSRGPILAVLVSLFFYYNSRGERKKGRIILLAVAATAILGVILMIFMSFSNVYMERFSLSNVFISAPGYRVSRYLFTLKTIPNRLIYGHGLGSWTRDYWGQVPYYPVWLTAQTIALDYPHNIVMEILYDGGLLCFIPFMIMLKKALKMKQRITNPRYEVLYYIFIANILYSFFSGSVTDGNRGLYYMLALLCGIMAGNKSTAEQ